MYCSNSHGQENRTPQEQVCFGDDILLRPLLKSDSRYCFFPATGVSPDSGFEPRVCSRAASDDSAYSEDSGSEDSGCSDESNNLSDEDDTNTETDAQCVNTTVDPFQALNEFSQYCATLRQNMMDQEFISDSEMPIESTDKQTHLPADPKAKVHQCDYEGCDYSTNQANNLKKHKQIHLPANQRARVHRCDHESCDYSTDQANNLKRHKQTHLTADQKFKRLKRKAHDQLPSSDKKRKKGNKG
ncbi:C2H2-type zinc finger protein [Endozoicomonas sp. 4G]|uniref:C2H2-type zinc finger protein n=1 Tax=Endozoicomonas sp. 4G TaxID=2872754 RepID=UPI002078E22E|nr:C2H2-type zinc finger protein [Endozoicomonas sp. 4G]